MEIERLSPSKINLSLAITGKRPDGFHELTSLVAPLAFGDRVRIEVSTGKKGIELESTNSAIPTGSENIAWQAADRFLSHFGLDASVRIHLEKRIPVGAGLGGGSSNAVAVLRGLADLFEIQDQTALFDLAAELGSDCPLFLHAEPLIMRGRGERIERLTAERSKTLSGLPVVLFKPPFGISTAWAYRALAESSGEYADSDSVESALAEWQVGKRPLKSILENSFSGVAGRKYPCIPLVLKEIEAETGAACLLSGSGSCCFALGDAESSDRIREIVFDRWGSTAFFESTHILDIGLTEAGGLSF